jgi:hypothetical protein
MLCKKEMSPLQNDMETNWTFRPIHKGQQIPEAIFFGLQFSQKAKDLRISALASKMGQAIKSWAYDGFKKPLLKYPLT